MEMFIIGAVFTDSMVENKTPKNSIDDTLTKQVQTGLLDGIKITAVSALMAYFDLTESCTSIPEAVGLTLQDPTGLTAPLLAFNVGAGTFAGYTKRIAASVTIGAVTLMPDVYQAISTGDPIEAGKQALAKGLVFGAAYAFGHIVSPHD